MQNKPENFSIEDAMRLANSPAGKQLIAALRSAGGNDLEQARKAAEKGDYNSARTNLTEVLKSPKIQALLREMEQNK